MESTHAPASHCSESMGGNITERQDACWGIHETDLHYRAFEPQRGIAREDNCRRELGISVGWPFAFAGICINPMRSVVGCGIRQLRRDVHRAGATKGFGQRDRGGAEGDTVARGEYGMLGGTQRWRGKLWNGVALSGVRTTKRNMNGIEPPPAQNHICARDDVCPLTTQRNGTGRGEGAGDTATGHILDELCPLGGPLRLGLPMMQVMAVRVGVGNVGGPALEWVFVQGVRWRVNTPLTLGTVVHCKGHLVGFQSEVDEGLVAFTAKRFTVETSRTVVRTVLLRWKIEYMNWVFRLVGHLKAKKK